ncbi:ribonuclease H-like domain-containing protein [Tanacetum coccineum]
MCLASFRHKHNADGSLSRYKARLMANGSTQLDVDETFSPVVKPATICTVPSLVISRHWLVYQLDVKNAFLHGYYLRPFICISLLAFGILVIRIMFVFCRDHCMGLDRVLGLGFRVLTASSSTLLQQVIGSLHAEFSMTDLGPSVTRNTSGMFLSQLKYATKVLERANMLACNPCRTPLDTDTKLAADGDPVFNPTLYRSLEGALQYLTFTRPDISYAVQQVCLFMHDPREPHFSALKRILVMLGGPWTMDYNFIPPRHPLWWHIQMQIGLVVLLHAGLLQVIVFFLATIFYLGLLSVSLHSLDQVLKLSIGELLISC